MKRALVVLCAVALAGVWRVPRSRIPSIQRRGKVRVRLLHSAWSVLASNAKGYLGVAPRFSLSIWERSAQPSDHRAFKPAGVNC
jgi:hypothetical protein